jgi:membrane-associated phospholipid phosphatase
MSRVGVVAISLSLCAHAAAAQDTVEVIPAEQGVVAPTPLDGVRDEPHIFAKLLGTLARDIKRLPSKDSAHLALNGSLLALAAWPLDEIATLGASSSHVLKAAYSGWGKALGREWVQGGAALGAYVAGRVLDRPRLATVGGDLIEAQLLAVTLTQGLKFAVRRERPDREARSFPSGHASAAFASATVLQRHFGRKIAIPAYAVAVYTSSSRLQANSHYASDVFIGATLGIIVGRTATIDLPGARVSLTPTPVRGGVYVGATLSGGR